MGDGVVENADRGSDADCEAGYCDVFLLYCVVALFRLVDVHVTCQTWFRYDMPLACG